MTVDVVTFGCRLNAVESEAMKNLAGEAGCSGIIVFNTCAVTGEAERQARQAIRRAHRDNPDKQIVVTGCAAQIAPETWATLPGVARVLGNADKLKPESWRSTESIVSDIMQAKETAGHLVTEFSGRARAFLQVQQGCDHRCTFCVIPYGRGPSRSVPMGEIATQMRALITQGFNEVVLTGVDITAYGPDLPGAPTLGQMVKRLLACVPELKRLRLSSLDPAEMDDDLWRLIAEEERLMPHLHLSVQAGDNMILKRMKRRHSRDDVFRCVERARTLRPGMAFGADIIAGFPTETDEMFENSLKLVQDAELTFLHVFPYSARPSTPAARMPQVPGDIRRVRAAALREAGAVNAAKFAASRVGAEADVLVERDGTGHSEHFVPVRGVNAPEGTIARVRIASADGDTLVAG